MELYNLEWVAGIIDGEGSIFATYNHGKPRFRVSVETSDTVICPTLHDRHGGSIRRRKSRKESSKDTMCWEISNKKEATVFLASIIPYLRLKKPQAIIAILGINSENDTLKKECLKSLRLLNARGK
jgi:hypothetical protein